MPFQIIRNDITKVKADAIVNTANPYPAVGRGTDTAIYEAAGWDELLAERKKIGEIPVGKAEVTSAFALPSRYIIHTVGPKWIDGSHGEEAALRSCYDESLKIAEDLNCESIAFPLLASGNFKFPKELAIRTATSVIYDFLMESDMMVYLVVYDEKAFELSGKLFTDVKDYLVGGALSAEEEIAYEASTYHSFTSQAIPAEPSLKNQIDDTNESFSEYLLQLINERDMKNSEVYRGANISKQVFSKIFSKKEYHPTKNTICALAISLHLSVDEANELLEKEGMILSRSSRFDIAVRYFLEHKMYNIVDDNIKLYDNGLEPLGQQ